MRLVAALAVVAAEDSRRRVCSASLQVLWALRRVLAVWERALQAAPGRMMSAPYLPKAWPASSPLWVGVRASQSVMSS